MNSALSEVFGPTGDGRSVEESVGFGLGHQFRIELLAALHEGPATRSELAKMLGQTREKLRWHVEELLRDGSIEVADWKMIGNSRVEVYRVTKLAYYSPENWARLRPAERQVSSALTLQAAWAEALASLKAGKFHSDSRVFVGWDWLLLDAQAREELGLEQTESFQRMQAIQATAAARRAESQELGKNYVIVSFGYERGRTTPPAPQPLTAGVTPSIVEMQSGDPLRTVEEAVSHSIAHRIRIEVLAALHDGPATASALARMVGQPLPLLKYHVDQLEEDGAVRIKEFKSVRHLEQPVYESVKAGYYSDSEWGELTQQERQVFSAISLRAAIAESMVSLRAGKFHSDPHVMVAWDWILLDGDGRRELSDEQNASWGRICTLGAEARQRIDALGVTGKFYVVTQLGFERSRTVAPEPLRSN